MSSGKPRWGYRKKITMAMQREIRVDVTRKGNTAKGIGNELQEYIEGGWAVRMTDDDDKRKYQLTKRV